MFNESVLRFFIVLICIKSLLDNKVFITDIYYILECLFWLVFSENVHFGQHPDVLHEFPSLSKCFSAVKFKCWCDSSG